MNWGINSSTGARYVLTNYTVDSRLEDFVWAKLDARDGGHKLDFHDSVVTSKLWQLFLSPR